MPEHYTKGVDGLERVTRWQYASIVQSFGLLTKKFAPQDVDAQLNQFGAEGWELVSAAPLTNEQGNMSGVLYTFKRPY